MKAISIRDAREQISHLEELVAQHGEILLTRHGKPILRILPMEGGVLVPSRAALRRQVPELLEPSEEALSQERDER